MLYNCLKFRKNIESKNPEVAKTNKGKLMIISKCAVSYSKKLRFIKYQEATANKNTFKNTFIKKKKKN